MLGPRPASPQHGSRKRALATPPPDEPAQQPDAEQQQSQQQQGPASAQSLLSFRKLRPLLVRQASAAAAGEVDVVALARQLGPFSTLSSSPATTAGGQPGGGVRVSGSGGNAVAADKSSFGQAISCVALGVPDLVAALERDTVLCRHPLLWKLHQQLPGADPSGN